MQYWYCFEAVSRTLKDICNCEDNSDIFGGIPILLVEDFELIAPGVRKGNWSTIVLTSLQSSSLWGQFHILSLTVNIRVQMGPDNIAFTKLLSYISYNSTMYGKLHLLPYIQAYTWMIALIYFVYCSAVLANALNNFTSFANHCIIMFHNDIVNQFNASILQQVGSIMQVFHTIDTCNINEKDPNFAKLPTEYLQSLDCRGLPSSCLELKVWCPIMWLWNFYLTKGLYNVLRSPIQLHIHSLV